MEVFAIGKVESGILSISNRKCFIDDLKIFEGLDVVVTVEKKKRKRTNPENRYYWGCVLPSLRHAMESKGFLITSKEVVHELCKFKFLKGEILNVANGELITTIGSTQRLSTIAFEEYMEQIRAYAASEYDCIIPLPNEQIEIFN